MNPPPLVRFEGVSKSFDGTTAVDRLDLDIAEGEFFALLGPSGCGKTTLMRLLAGFETPDEGCILLGGRDIADVPPHRRPTSMMFQNYALFPHLNVERNVAFGLKQQGWESARAAARVEEVLTLVRLEGLNRRRTDQLSGGQKQRVALARALAPRPKILLLDEPLAALDRRLREQTQLELKALQRQLGVTFLIVTHDQDEAMAVADRIGVMRDGRLAQVGSPQEIYERPSSRYVAEFLGDANLFPTGGGWLLVRPERMVISAQMSAGAMEGRVADITYLGDRTRYAVTTAIGQRLLVNRSRHLEALDLTVGDLAFVAYPPEAAVELRT